LGKGGPTERDLPNTNKKGHERARWDEVTERKDKNVVRVVKRKGRDCFRLPRRKGTKKNGARTVSKKQAERNSTKKQQKGEEEPDRSETV